MEGNLASPPHWAIAPYFIVDDVVTTANYYRDKLGFHYERFWGEPPRRHRHHVEPACEGRADAAKPHRRPE